MSIEFEEAYPIGETDVDALPVKDLPSAIGYYTQVLGFAVVSKDESSAVLRRGSAEIGLEINDVDPDDASLYFEVSDPDALRDEYEAKGIEPSPIRVDEGDDADYRIFFAKEPYGVCFCFGKTLPK